MASSAVSAASGGKRLVVVAAGLAGLAFAAYVNALANGLVWDDPIVLDRQLRAFRSLADVFFPPHNIPQFSPDYYRPLTTLSYLIDRALGGSGPFPFHLSVVVYHVAATVLVFFFGRVLFTGEAYATLAAALGAAFFAVHPIHSESVAWGAGRSDVIAGALGLGGALVYRAGPRSTLLRGALSAALILLGALAKETAITLLVLVPALDLIVPRQLTAIKPRQHARAERRRRDMAISSTAGWESLVPFALALVVYLTLRNAALESLVGKADPLDVTALRNVVGAVGLYLSKLVLPLQQSAYISDLPIAPLQLAGTAVALIAIAVAVAVAWRRDRRIAILLAWVPITLAPSLAIVVKIPAAPVAERYLYIPSIGFCLLVGWAFAVASTSSRGQSVHRIAAVSAALLLSVAFAAVVKRNAVWRSNMTLWEDTAARNTTDGLPLRSLAAAYLDKGDAQRAEQLFREALQRRNNASGLHTIHNNLGALAMRRKQYDEAEADYRRAMEFSQTPDTVFNLGLIALARAIEPDPARSAESRQQQAREARDLLQRAADANPHDPDTRVALGQALQAMGDKPAARQQFDRALEMGLAQPTADAVRKLLAQLN